MTIGIIGGLGHRAGAAFYQELIARTPSTDEPHQLPVVLVSRPDLPDRIAHLGGRGPSPLPGLRAMVRQLEACGARLICIPSATTHAYIAEIQLGARARVMNLLSETAAVIAADGLRRVGVIATSATARLMLFEPPLADGVALVYPDEVTQHRIQAVIESLKATGATPTLAEEVGRIFRGSWADDVDSFLLGCTELHLVTPLLPISHHPIVDIATVLADAVIRETSTGLTRDPLHRTQNRRLDS
ncbi:aspartate/glutamate racemase family protein [Microbacterium arabinogalactanolyticum]|uniref:aspartate/glutamate racemase family protein n=1 Tax=Microbacterium arabinogalactanolyticum TaxID=69365 RepID=UPI004044CB55